MLGRRASGPGRADSLHGLSPGLEDARPSPTPPETLRGARRIALDNGVRHAYTGNVHDAEGGTTLCHSCRAPLIVRDWYTMLDWRLTGEGRCAQCGVRCAGVFDGPPGEWGSRRRRVWMAGRDQS